MTLDELEKLAKAATQECPGDWRSEFTVHEPEITHHVVDDTGEILATPSAIIDSVGDIAYRAATAYIAAASPDVVLALVAVARASRGVIEAFSVLTSSLSVRAGIGVDVHGDLPSVARATLDLAAAQDAYDAALAALEAL